VLAEQRQSLILDMVNQRGAMSITDIQRKLKVARETIRRDILQLAERRAVTRTHGGAVALKASEAVLDERQAINTDAKRMIGERAARLVPDRAAVMLGGGSTVLAVADALLERRRLSIISNSLAVCGRFAGRNGNRVTMIGGTIQTANSAAVGSDAVAMLARYFADFAFIGAGAISSTGWVMDYTPEEADLYALMARSAHVSAVVADRTKFNQQGAVRVVDLRTVTYLVTDRRPTPPLAGAIASSPLELIADDKRRTVGKNPVGDALP
jgi:DeoR family glycerol-3-phosphate regulon repressor